MQQQPGNSKKYYYTSPVRNKNIEEIIIISYTQLHHYFSLVSKPKLLYLPKT